MYPKIETANCFKLYPVFCFISIASQAHINGPEQSSDTTIRGKIVDSTGAGLADVSVTVKGLNRGTTTGSGGDFVLYNVPSRSTLVISAIGFQEREIMLATGQSYLTLYLSSQAGTLTDVIVTGFQRIEKANLQGLRLNWIWIRSRPME